MIPIQGKPQKISAGSTSLWSPSQAGFSPTRKMALETFSTNTELTMASRLSK